MQVQLMSYRTIRSSRRERRDRTLVRAVSFLCFAVFMSSALLALSGRAKAETAAQTNGLFLRPMTEALPMEEGADGVRLSDRPYFPAPRLAQTIRLDVAGVVARGAVTQVFRNDTTEWVEGRYRFPLPDDAAVDQLIIRVDDRVVEGQIKEREEAQQTYETARDAGQTAALLSEERPNLFTISLANIGPGEVIAVELAFQAKVTREGDAFEFRMPLVAAPRYLPEMALAAIDHPALRAAIARQLEDAARLGFPIDLSRQSNATALEIALDAGAEIASLESPSHELIVSREGERYRIGLRLGEEPADRDMVLRWQTVRDAIPGATLFHEHIDGTDYLLAMISPPDADAAALMDQARDVTFILDTSGSMAGESMRAAQTALMEAILALNPEDRFEVIEFDNEYSRLFGGSRPADDAAVERAVRWVASLHADGGTEMAGPLRTALNGYSPPDFLRQIVFLTDGQVGNENELFGMIEANLDDTRLFTVGLGSAPNGWFMRKSAELGAGQTISITNDAEAAERMAAFYNGIEQPVAVDLTLAVGQGEVELYPARLPDLYGAWALMIPIAVKGWDGTFTLDAQTAEGAWSLALDRSDTRPAEGIAKLWAEGKVESLLDDRRRGVLSYEEAREDVLAVALPHRLATEYTSFVAVDKQVRRPDGTELYDTDLPNNLPDGIVMASLTGPAGAVGLSGMVTAGVLLILGSLALLGVARLTGGRSETGTPA